MAKPDRIFASELLEREVMDLRAGEIVGAVTDFNVTREGVVTQLGVLPLQWYRGGKGIAPGAITNVTRERVSIEDSTLLEEFNPDGEASLSAMLGDNLYGKQVLQADGELLGNLADFAFDLTDGSITDIVVFGDDDKRTKIAVASIQTIGKAYIVVNRAGPGAEVQPGPKMAAPSARAEVAAASTVVVETEEVPESLATADEIGPHTYEPEVAAVEHEPEAEAPPPIVEEVGPPVAPEPAAERRPRRMAASHGNVPAEPKSEPEPKTATGRGSRPKTESGTGRASRPRTERAEPRRADEQLKFSAEAEVAPAPAAAETLEGLGLSTFDLRKAEYLLGKAAHRDIRGADGKLLLTRGTPFNRSRISALLEQGLLNSVFLEMTQHKG